MAAVSWANYVYNRTDNKDAILIISDSGLFVPNFFNPFTNSTSGDESKYMSELIYTETPPPYTECLIKYGEKCGITEVI